MIFKNTRRRRFWVRFCCRPGGGKKRHIPYDFNMFIFVIFLKDFCEFQKTQGTADSRTTFVAVPEAAKSDTSFRILTFLILLLFFKIFAIFKNTRHRRFSDHFWCRPGGGKKRHILYDFNILICFIFFNLF